MLKIFCLILIGILVLFIGYYIKRKMFEREIANQLARINKGISSNRIEGGHIFFSKNLISEINTTIDKLIEEQKKLNSEKQNMKEIITAISHDFRTPLTSISGYVQFLTEDKDIDEDKRKNFLNIIKMRSESLATLVEDFYVNSSIESQEYPKRKSKVMILDVLRNSIFQYYRELEARFENVNINLPEEQIEIEADIAYIQRIFSNIIKNAFTHGVKNFSIVGEKDESGKLKIYIGNKINKDDEKNNFDVQKIFERNYSVNWFAGNKSTGLGMSIAQKLMHEMGYNIYATVDDDEISIILEF